MEQVSAFVLICQFCNICSGFLSVSFVLAMQCLSCLEIALAKFEKLTRDKYMICAIGNTEEFSNENLISKGLYLYDLVKKVNNMFGGILLYQYGHSLFFATFGIYFSTTIFKVYIEEISWINEMVLMFSLANILIVVFKIYKIYMMQAKGQVICNHFASIRDNLENMSLVFAKHLDLEAERKLRILISRFSANSSPIRPCDVFDMNTASFVSISGIILTYLIVLLQFKLSVNTSDNPTNVTLGDLPSLLENKTIADLEALIR